MLQAPSHLSRVCGHGHIKKFWLTQMQNESQTCENKSGLLPSYSRPVSGSSVKGPDCKQSPQRSSGSPSVKSLLTGAAPAGRPVRPVLAGAVTVNGGYGIASTAVRHGSLATCAESLSPPLRPDQTYRSLRPSFPDLSDGNAKENDALDAAEEVDCSSPKAPLVEDLSASSSRCGSPSAELGSRHLEQDLAGNACGEAEPTKASNVESLTGSRPTTNGGDLFSSWEDCRGVGEGDANASQEEQAEYFKCVDNDSSENHSVEPENSDSGTDAGNSEYVSSPVRVARTGALDNRVRSLEGKAVCNGWTLAVPSSTKGECEKRSRIAEVCTEVLSANRCELSPENGNSTHNSVLRICSLCGTTKTPLWRSGPHGPKSLCNACGIRFKKSRRCSGQSEGSELLGSPSATPSTTGPLYRPLKRKQDTQVPCEARRLQESGADTVVPEASFQHPKRSRWPKLTLRNEAAGHIGEITGSSGESCLTWNLLSPSSGSPSSKKLDLHARMRVDLERLHAVEEHGTVSRAISKDEEEAALLLMYLSCGFVYA